MGEGETLQPLTDRLIPEFRVWQDEQGWHGVHIGSDRRVDADTLRRLEVQAIAIRIAWALM